jgi:hypothetical protein
MATQEGVEFSLRERDGARPTLCSTTDDIKNLLLSSEPVSR